jgi:O-methyltransferase
VNRSSLLPGSLRARRGPGSLYRQLQSLRFLLTRDRRAAWAFLRSSELPLSLAERLALVARFDRITNQVRGYHTLGEMLAVAGQILRRPGPVTVIEAGCGKGSSTAKLSLATRRAGGRLLVFDSFRGIPTNTERHHNLDGRPVVFRKGAFCGRLPAVQRTVATLGAPEVCHYVKGWFEDTLPELDRHLRTAWPDRQPAPAIDVAILDVDLLSSTRSCLRAIVPRLARDGVLFSQDGHLRATHDLLGSRRFWEDEVGVAPPHIEGLGHAKLLVLRPPPTGR